jgi:ParB family chromosome partitioning protein
MKKTAASVRILPVAEITVLNPRARNKKIFAELVESIASVGLKKPITVRNRLDGTGYDLVCGQGRYEAIVELGQTEIPAIVIEATDEDCFVMSLVENLARRQHTSLELLREVDALRAHGYTYVEVGQKTGLSPEYVTGICFLLANGEHRLLRAVEKGVVPHSIATEIARADEADVQAALMEAYENKTIPGNQIVAIRRIIEQRRSDGKGRSRNRPSRAHARPVTGESLVRAYRKELERQKRQIRKADLAQNRLIFVVNALRTLLTDRQFETLLRAEGMPTMPRSLAERIAAAQ